MFRDKLQDKLHRVKSGLHLSCKDRKYTFANAFFKLSAYALVCFTRNICNRYVDSFNPLSNGQTLFGKHLKFCCQAQ